jgi:hypothetical protein
MLQENVSGSGCPVLGQVSGNSGDEGGGVIGTMPDASGKAPG